MLTAAFIGSAALTLAGAVAALALRNLVHCALALVAAFAGLAALYLQLGAQFIGFAQVLVYIGAVAILLVFAILLTGGREPERPGRFSSNAWLGGAIGLGVLAVLSKVILSSPSLKRPVGPLPEVSVRQIGEQLMTRYVLPLEVLGLLLTAALIGAVVLAMREKEGQ